MSQRDYFTLFVLLPPEMRLEVYKNVMASFDFDHERPAISEPGVLRACRFLRAEAMPAYIKRLDTIVRERQEASDRAMAVVDAAAAANESGEDNVFEWNAALKKWYPLMGCRSRSSRLVEEKKSLLRAKVNGTRHIGLEHLRFTDHAQAAL